MARGEGYNSCVTKTVAASTETVFRAYTDPAAAGWLGLTELGANGAAFTDLDGNRGTWLRQRMGKDVRLAWQTEEMPHSTQADASFAGNGKGRTAITLMHQRIQTRAEEDGLRAAWSAGFLRLKAELEGGSTG